jgi:hypothetical protein
VEFGIGVVVCAVVCPWVCDVGVEVLDVCGEATDSWGRRTRPCEVFGTVENTAAAAK